MDVNSVGSVDQADQWISGSGGSGGSEGSGGSAGSGRSEGSGRLEGSEGLGRPTSSRSEGSKLRRPTSSRSEGLARSDLDKSFRG